LKLTHKFVALVAGVILLVAVLALASIQIFGQVENAVALRKNSLTLLTRADALLGDMVDAEAAQVSFLVTGDEAHLKPYMRVRDQMRLLLDDMRPLASTAAAQQHLAVITPLVEAKLEHMSQTIQLRRHSEMSAVITDSGFGRGRILMDSIRAEMANFIQVEKRALEQHDADIQSSMRRLFILIVTASLFTLLLALFFAYLIYRESQRHGENLLHRETQRLLDVQEDVNKKLQQTNTNLHISEEKLAVTLNSIDDAVIATDAKGLVTLLNPLAERLTGWTRVEACNRPVEEIFHIIHADTRLPYDVPVRETLAQGTTLSLANHTIVIARDGSECDIADSCAPIRDRNGQVVGAVLVFRDVTERKRLDKVLLDKNSELESARSVAEKANLAKSEFLSSMSHELRTPLSAILGFAQLLDSGSPAPTPAQKRSVDQILKAGWYLLDLINEILDLALIESGRLSLSMEPISLNEVIHECQIMIEPQAQARGIGVAFPGKEESCQVFVKADRTRVKQVLVNLLSNAIKYNSAGGTVVVDCSTPAPQRLRVSVTDTGAGLSPEQLAQLFQPFNRLGQEAYAEQGTGIGLVMSKRLMELMGGAIGAQSKVGTGSVFWMEMNLTAAPQTVAGATALAPVVQTQDMALTLRTLLYVEDNPANLMLVEDLIARRPDIRLISAKDGVTGIQMALTSQPDVVLMDINLPGISGIQALEILAENPATAHIPVVALSANAMPRDIEKGLEAGFYCYLTKPIKVNEFMQTLDVAFAYAKTQSPDATHATPKEKAP
jgi:PAS domain S-box-containing protein